MNRFLAVLVVALSTALAGCGPTLQLAADTIGVDVVTNDVVQSARKTAFVSFTTWERIQDGIKRYGRLQPCVDNGQPKILCRDPETWKFIQEKERQVSGVLEAARPLIEAGSNDVQLLMSIPQVVQEAQIAISARVVITNGN